MRRIDPTQIDSSAVHVAVVAAKVPVRRTRLQAIEAEVLARIADLEHNGPFALPYDDLGHLGHHPDCDPCIYDDLRHLWSTPTEPLLQLKAELIDEFLIHNIGDC